MDTVTDIRMRPDGEWEWRAIALPVAVPVVAPGNPHAHWVRRAAITLAVLVVVAFIALILYIYAQQGFVPTDGGIPLIRAETAEYRFRPEQPGGLDVPNQDRMVLQDLGRAAPPTEVAAVLPPPETPLPRPVANGLEGGVIVVALTGTPLLAKPRTLALPITGEAEILLARAAPIVTVEDALPPRVPAAVVEEAFPPPATDAPARSAAEPETRVVLSIPLPTAAEPAMQAEGAADWLDPDALVATIVATADAASMEAVAAEPSGIAPVPGGTFAAQIASVASAEEAQAEWRRFQRRYPEIFGGLALAEVEIPGARLGFPVRAVPLDQATARQVCAALASENTGCLVVPR